MKLYIVKNAGLAGARDYNISLVVDRDAETVRATLALRVPQSSDPEIGDEAIRAYVDKGSVQFSARELVAPSPPCSRVSTGTPLWCRWISPD